ncbi:hypothetical protein CANARDRAFT_26290, partial [[Candida] arabinofermentans NRRL YB-2248]
MIWQQSTSLPPNFLSTEYLIGNSSLTNYQLYQLNKFIGLLIYIVKSQRILAHQPCLTQPFLNTTTNIIQDMDIGIPLSHLESIYFLFQSPPIYRFFP